MNEPKKEGEKKERFCVCSPLIKGVFGLPLSLLFSFTIF